MEIIDSIKEFAGTAKEKATDLAQAGVAQAKRLAEIAKLKTANMGEEDTIKKAYIEIGKLYYAEKGAAPEGAFAAACEKVTAAKAAIEANNERIEELKAESEEPIVEEEPAEAAEAVEEAVEAAAETVEEAGEAAAEAVEEAAEAVEEAAEEIKPEE